MDKAVGTQIVTIAAGSSTTGGGGLVSQVFGLGDDMKVYYWDSMGHKWILYAS